MYKQKRKGFTLVELLVVIAILSVLATVSIIGYTQFIKKAHISNDLSLITQINRGLEAAQIGADKPATLHEARTILDDLGFDLPKLTPTTAKHNYVWNCETNRFLLISDKLEVVAPQGAKLDASKSFAVAHNEEELATWQEKGFSVYLADEFKLESGALEITKGIDVGNNNIDINYTNTSGPAQEIIIRTNGGRLTIDGYVNSTDSTNGDVITHYNISDEVEIIKCATQSYHEKGTVAFVSIAIGRLVVENGGEISVAQRTSTGAIVALNGGVIKSAVATTEELKITDIAGLECPIKTEEEIAEIKENAIQENIMTTVDFSDCVARIGRTGYKTLNDAVADAKDGNTIVVLQDFEIQKSVTIGTYKKPNSRTLTIDLNGHTLTGKNRQSFALFTIYDNITLTGDGVLICQPFNNYGNACKVYGTLTVNGAEIKCELSPDSGPDLISIYSGATCNLINGSFISAKVNAGTVRVFAGSTFNMTGGEVKNTFQSTNQYDKRATAICAEGNVNISGGNITSKQIAVLITNPQNKPEQHYYKYNVNISGGNIKGDNAVYSEAYTNATITGGELIGVAEAVHALGNTIVNISGGTFKSGTTGGYVLNKQDADKSTATIWVTGGTFHGFNPANNTADGPETNFVAEGYTVKTSTDADGKTIYIVSKP